MTAPEGETVGTSELEQLITRLQRNDSGSASSATAVVDDFLRPLRVQIAGRAGVGRSSVARALDCAGAEIATTDHPDGAAPALDGDLVIYVLAESAQPADRAALVEHERVLIVLNKADAIPGGWPAAAARADSIAECTGSPTVPLVASTAAATVAQRLTPSEVDSLRTLADGNDPILLLSPDLFVDADVAVPTSARRALLDRWDFFGVGCAIDTLRREPTLDADALLLVMHGASGVPAARAALAGQLRRNAQRRAQTLLDELARLAARGDCRDDIEEFLRSAAGSRILQACHG
ncbi:hypothetical protein FOS14_07440 [Skermania sp. ID1734]|uniref:hypothetical protein n=1 Tax=Skermania sp. ID1734 TaxID=2597516 RepID=UPI00117F10F4|nr:hypothetical protein [Skermania sp. ID1734]TSE00258.1 hypothetical protein FOS14_07440 [Skermania sp. ID1734]